MSNVLSEHKQQQVIALGRLGWSLRRIERETGVRRETASAYLKAAGVEVRPPGRWGHQPKPAIEVSPDPGQGVPAEALEDKDLEAKPAIEVSPDPEAKPAKEVSPDPACPRPGRSPSASACEPFRELIELGLRQGRNAKVIWQDLVDFHGFEHRYASVKRFVKKLRGQAGPAAHPVIVTAPGEEAQVDYGTGPMVRHPETGKYRRTRLFVLTLGYSRKSVYLLRFKSSSRIWAELHEEAFRRLGGVTKVVVLDNLREGVLKADVYDPTLNPLFADMLRHYNATALPCRVNHPNRKGKVESGVNYAQNKLQGLRFESLELGQTYLDRWDENWADTRIHGTTKRQVGAMFEEELPHLQPLPLEPFRYYQHGVRTVHLDGCIEVEGAYYGAPPGRIGQQLTVQWDTTSVRLIETKTGELLIEHLRQKRGWFRVREEHRPKKTPQGLTQVLARAHLSGTQIGALCEEIHRQEGELGARRILGVMALVKKHGPKPVERACSFALEAGAPTYRFVSNYMKRQHGHGLLLKQVDPLIRELTHYRDLIQQRTKEAE